MFFTPLGRHSRCVVSTQLVLIAPPWSPQGAAAEQFEFFPPPCAGTSAAQFDYHFSQPLHRLSATYFLYAPLRQHSRFATQVSLLVSIPPAPAQPLRSLGVAPLFFAPLRRHSRCASSVSPRWWPQPMRSFSAFVFFRPHGSPQPLRILNTIVLFAPRCSPQPLRSFNTIVFCSPPWSSQPLRGFNAFAFCFAPLVARAAA